MKNFKLKASVLAVSLAMSGATFAAITLDQDPLTASGAKTYASEVVTNGLPITGGTAIDIAHKLNFGVSKDQTRFLRYDLTNATFSNSVVAADLTFSCVTPTVCPTPLAVPNATVALASQGPTFVIFQITALDNLPVGADVAFNLGSGAATGFKVTNVASSATMQYRLYETATAAVAAGASLTSADGSLANFASGIALTPIPDLTTADVTALVGVTPTPYAKFKTTGASAGISATLTNIGSVIFGPVGGVNKADGNPITQPDLVANNTKLIVSGLDLSAAASATDIFLDNNDNCASTSIPGSNKTSTTVEFVTNTTAITSRNVCFRANGTTPIAEQAFTIAATIVAAPNTTTASIAAKALGNFDHDGTVLKVPFSQGTAGQTTFVNLANMGNVNAPFTTRCFTGPGTPAPTAGVVGTVLAGNTKKLKSADLLCAAGTSAVEFTLAVPSGTVVGTFVRQNNTTGDSGMSDVTGNQ